MRQSNVDRDSWRAECRERLSNHIQSTLRINVKPSEVRLNPSPNEPYAWKILPEKQRFFSELFLKNLSQHSIRAYKALCEGVGVSFEAVLVNNNINKLNNITSLLPKDITFSVKIEQLESANTKLGEELEEWKKKASAESERAMLTEEQARRLRERTEEQLCKMNGSNHQLQEQIKKYAATAEYFKSMLIKCFQGLETTLPVFEELKKDISLIVS